MVTSRVFGWNTLIEDLIKLNRNLAALGIEINDGEAYLVDIEEAHIGNSNG